MQRSNAAHNRKISLNVVAMTALSTVASPRSTKRYVFQNGEFTTPTKRYGPHDIDSEYSRVFVHVLNTRLFYQGGRISVCCGSLGTLLDNFTATW